LEEQKRADLALLVKLFCILLLVVLNLGNQVCKVLTGFFLFVLDTM
jgi:hypothetical protein